MPASVSLMLPATRSVGAVKAVCRQMQRQLLQDFELEVCDDAMPGLCRQIDEMGVDVVTHQATLGRSEAINTLARRARGRWWGVLDADCHYEVWWLERLINHVDVDVGVVYSGYSVRIGDRVVRVQPDEWRYGQILEMADVPFGPSALIRGDVWKLAGEWLSSQGAEYDFWTRVEEVCHFLGYKMKAVGEVLMTSWQERTEDVEPWRQMAMERRKRMMR